jgi:alpha-glucosidase (family GH31 glycosyl hydrolase)
MAKFSLDIVDGDLHVYRDESIILRGHLDLQAGPPRITEESNGWRIEHPNRHEAEDVFDVRTFGHWFGGQELLNQLWPLERVMLDAAPFITSDNGPQGLSSIQTPLWLASSGVAILADHDQVLRVGFNRSRETQSAYTFDSAALAPFERRPPPDDGTGDGRLRVGGQGLKYRILVGGDMIEAWHACLPHLGHPESLPPEALWRAPIWTTWARFKTDINQTRVSEFADEIIAHGYPHSVLEIDDRWQTHYGDLAFDPGAFPDPRAMVEALHARGFAVTCWVMPFINPDADNLMLARERDYLLCRADGSPLPVRWWLGDGFLLDVANAESLVWFGDNLRQLQAATGLDGFKFDAGEALYAQGSNEYTHRYVEFVAANFPFSEVRCGWGNQGEPLLFRQWDKSSAWGANNGLKSVVTGALAIGLAGYPFVLPDMVGGNAYNGEHPDAELMIRWTQASALFPSIQFSLAPWEYGDECDRLCRAALDLRQHYLDRIGAALHAAAESGEPVIRPVWWLSPDDERAQVCHDEFLLGDSLLVAPLMQPGRRARDVYLPPGEWRERRGGETIAGPTVLSDVSAPLDTLLVYERS